MTYLASDMRHGMQSWHRRGRVERPALLSMSGGATRSSTRLVADLRASRRPLRDLVRDSSGTGDSAERGLEVKTIRPNLLSVVCNGRFTGILAVLYHSLT